MFTLTLAGLLLEVIEGAAAMSTDDRGLVFEVVAGATGWKHRHTLLEFRTVSSLEHARFSLKVHGSVPTVALPTKWAAEGDEEAWKGGAEGAEVTPCTGCARNVNRRIWITV